MIEDQPDQGVVLRFRVRAGVSDIVFKLDPDRMDVGVISRPDIARRVRAPVVRVDQLHNPAGALDDILCEADPRAVFIFSAVASGDHPIERIPAAGSVYDDRVDVAPLAEKSGMILRSEFFIFINIHVLPSEWISN